ncbi:anti-sigma factor [Aquimarina sediminis]|uniref:anti-sigma factor n=1 Tax=Aquimarina sediminis TaxID=2070536 RepID=UPI000CA03FFA|nr:anti-sigma factor [Aquimarina sediminis]
MTKNFLVLTALFIGVLFTSCSSDDDNAPVVSISLDTIGLEVLTGGSSYQGWLIVNGQPKPTAKFTDPTGVVNLEVLASDAKDATQFILTIEPVGDADNIPSDTRILIGNFSGTAAQLGFSSVVADISNVSGQFFLATPTDNENGIDNNNDEFGVWFMNGDTAPGLTLPVLESGWKYEGWVDFGNKVVSTGTFSKANVTDDGNLFKGSGGVVPPFPGEDFLVLPGQVSLPGITFPASVLSKKVTITIEPSNDKDPAPFFIAPLTGTAGITTGSTKPIQMITNTAVPSGRATRPN